MNCEVCQKKVFKNNLCEKHYMRGVNRLRKVIDYWRIKGTPYKPTHTFESMGFDDKYTESPYGRKK